MKKKNRHIIIQRVIYTERISLAPNVKTFKTKANTASPTGGHGGELVLPAPKNKGKQFLFPLGSGPHRLVGQFMKKDGFFSTQKRVQFLLSEK